LNGLVQAHNIHFNVRDGIMPDFPSQMLLL
jgi:hypothetical protein